jgi:hypothetical protein
MSIVVYYMSQKANTTLVLGYYVLGKMKILLGLGMVRIAHNWTLYLFFSFKVGKNIFHYMLPFHISKIYNTLFF